MRHFTKAGLASLVAVALLLPVAPTSAGDSYDGKWKGKTEDDERVVFRVQKDELTRFRARYTVFAGDLCHGVDIDLSIEDLEVPIEDDAFKFKHTKKDRVDGAVRTTFVKISGSFDSAEKAAGKLKAWYRLVSYGIIYCSGNGTFEWKAHKV
jgi:hypothetical protein